MHSLKHLLPNCPAGVDPRPLAAGNTFVVVPNVLFLTVSHRTSEARFYYITGEYDASSRRMREKAFSFSQLNGRSPGCASDGCEPRDQGVIAFVWWRVRERDTVGCGVEVTVRGEGRR